MATQNREITFISLAKEAVAANTPADLNGNALNLGIAVDGVEMSNDSFADMAAFDGNIANLVAELEATAGIIDVSYTEGTDGETVDIVIQSNGEVAIVVSPTTDISSYDINQAMHVANGSTEIQVDSRRPVRLDAHAELGLQSVIAALSSSHAAV